MCEGLSTRAVNPAWTSVLGQADYACVYGLSVDQGAAVVIARRALGLRTRLRPTVAARVAAVRKDEGAARALACDEARQVSARAGTVHNGLSSTQMLRKTARMLSDRSSTWDKDGLARRNTCIAGLLEASASPDIPGASYSSAVKLVARGKPKATGFPDRGKLACAAITEAQDFGCGRLLLPTIE
jgi:hypothetical protein